VLDISASFFNTEAALSVLGWAGTTQNKTTGKIYLFDASGIVLP